MVVVFFLPAHNNIVVFLIALDTHKGDALLYRLKQGHEIVYSESSDHMKSHYNTRDCLLAAYMLETSNHNRKNVKLGIRFV